MRLIGSFSIYRASQSSSRAPPDPTKASPGPPRAPPEPPRVDPDLLSPPMPPELSSNFFSTFVGTPHAKSYFFGAFLEGHRPNMVSEVGVLCGPVMKKSKKNIAPERHKVTNYCKNNIKCMIWNTPAESGGAGGATGSN